MSGVVKIDDKNEYIIYEEGDIIDGIIFKLVTIKQIIDDDYIFEAKFKSVIKGNKKHFFQFSLSNLFFSTDLIDSTYRFNRNFDKIAIVKTDFYPKVFLVTQNFNLLLTNWDTLEECQKYLNYNDLLVHYIHLEGASYSLVADADENIDGVNLPIPHIKHVDSNDGICIEKETLYSKQIQKMNHPCFSDIQNISARYFQRLDEDENNSLFEQLNHGERILSSEGQLYAYMYSYGKMHEAKMLKSLQQIPGNFFFDNDEVEIIDYACGQAIATICFKDYLDMQEFDTSINRIILIEPSEKALARASLHCKKVSPESELVTIKKDFDGLNSNDIPQTNITRIHFLSNILDIDSYDIRHLAKTIKKVSNIGDLFVCVSPWYHDNRDGRQRWLMKLLNSEELYHDRFNKYQLVQDKPWTAVITLFKR